MNDLQRRFIEVINNSVDNMAKDRKPEPAHTYVIPRWLEQACIDAGMTLPANVVVLHGPPRYHQLHPDHRGP